MQKLTVIAMATLLAFSTTAFAADTKEQEPKAGMKQGMKQGMKKNGTMGPHYRLGMGYRKNLVNFAETLKTDVASSGKVDKQFAETAVREMRDTLEKMRKHHETMSDDMKARMGERMKMMEDRLTVVGQHLDKLESEVKAEQPDPKKVTMEVDQILKQCEMMKMKDMQKKKKTGM